MRIVILIALFVQSTLCHAQQSEHTYTIDSAKINSDGSNEWEDISNKIKGFFVSVNFKEEKIEIDQFPARIFSITRFFDPVKEAKGDTFQFRCLDDKKSQCTIYIAFTYDHKDNPTLFVQYENSNEMYYLKTP